MDDTTHILTHTHTHDEECVDTHVYMQIFVSVRVLVYFYRAYIRAWVYFVYKFTRVCVKTIPDFMCLYVGKIYVFVTVCVRERLCECQCVCVFLDVSRDSIWRVGMYYPHSVSGKFIKDAENEIQM